MQKISRCHCLTPAKKDGRWGNRTHDPLIKSQGCKNPNGSNSKDLEQGGNTAYTPAYKDCILDENIAQPEEVDAVMRKLGMPMGPYEIMDYTGLDINVHASNYFAQEVHPDFAAGKTIAAIVAAGDLGKKSGKGLFDWSKGRPEIDLSKASEKFDPMDLVAINANEATKIVDMGVCSLEDVDTAIINATGNPMGLIALIKGIEPVR